MNEYYVYQKLDENMELTYLPMHDLDGAITGKIIIGLKAYFDEHEDERKALGWIKHITPNSDEVEYNRATEYIMAVPRWIDEYTMIDDYVVMTKSEDRMVYEELMNEGGTLRGIVLLNQH